MTRKDTILIAVVINAGLLAILFATAIIYDIDKGDDQVELSAPILDNKSSLSEPSSTLIAHHSIGDEVDNVLKYYTSPQSVEIQNQREVYLSEPMSMSLQSNIGEENSTDSEGDASQERFVEVTVKKGDMLEKIAKANKTTVGAIKRANHLENERLSVGQVLKIPLKQAPSVHANAVTLVQAEAKKESKQEISKESQSSEPVYYVIKSGDNPWKVAKQFGVKYDEILRINNLDEEKARNLKIGDRIRVK
jgi:LysM repeat protein